MADKNFMPAYELNFRDYLRILRKRYWILVLAVVSTTVLVLIYNSFQKSKYKAVVTVRIEERKTLVGAIMNSPVYFRSGVGDYIASEIRVIKSRPVAEASARRMGWIKDTMDIAQKDIVINGTLNLISVEQEEKTDLVKIIVTSIDAQRAAGLANTVAIVYQEENLKQKNREARTSREFIEKQLIQAEGKLKIAEDTFKTFREKETATGVGVALSNRLGELQTQLSQLLTKATEQHPEVLRAKEEIANIEQQLKNLPESELEYVRLNRDVEVNDKVYRMLRDKVEEARIAEAEKVSDVTIVNPAGERGFPVGANKARSSLIGLLMGLVIGFTMILVSENLDTSIATIEDVESFIKLPVLGVIPSVKREKEEKDKLKPKSLTSDRCDIAFTVCLEPNSPFTEAFRILRTNLKIEKSTKTTLLITSTGPREGKTMILSALGLVLSQMGLKTLLVDTDLRRPSVSKVFGVEREPGLTDLLLSGIKEVDKIIKNFTDFLMGNLGFEQVTQLPGLEFLSLLSSGALTSSSAEVLSSDSMTQVIKELKDKFDVVIFDSPPALSLTDASILAKRVDGVIIVYEVGRTSRDALLRTKIQLESMAAKMLGVILNHTRPQTEFQTSYYPYYKSYKYRYYYTDKEEGKKIQKTEDAIT
ncbi:MAG: GNVR domain-containing protein [Candidatus Omnitrophota bacterium]